MRVLVFSPMVRFAMQHYLQCIADEIDRLGHEPTFILPSHNILETRHRIVTIGGGSWLNTLWTNVNPLTFLRLAGVFFREAPDCVHFLNGETRLTVLWMLLLCRLTGTRSILSVHDPEPHPCAKLDVLAYHLIARRSVRVASEINIHDKAHAPIASAWGKELHIFPFPDISVLFPSESMAKREDVVLFFGRIEPYKGLPKFVELGLKMRGRARFVIAGTGTIDEELQKTIEANSDIFELHHRFIEDSEMLRLYDRAKIVLLPYDSATQSGIPAGAASRGAIPVGFAVGGLVNQIPDVGGRVATAGNMDEMEAIVSDILDDYSEPDRATLTATSQRFILGLKQMYGDYSPPSSPTAQK